MTSHLLNCKISWIVLVSILVFAAGCSSGSTGASASSTPARGEDYSLALTSSSVTIAQGANAPLGVTLTRTNFTGPVTLSLDNAPPGISGSFNPPAPTGDTATLTLSVDPAVAPGTYNLTVDGTGTAGNHSTLLTLTVNSAAVSDYSLALTSSSVTIAQGANAPLGVTLTRTNFTGPVTLSLGNAPPGISGSFNPPAPTGDTATLTISVDPAVAPGTYNLTVDGTGTAGNRSAQLTLTVSSTGVSDYSVTLSPTALTIAPGGNTSVDVTLTRTNFTGPVTLSLGNAPPGVSGSFHPPAPTGNTATLTVGVGLAVAPGTYNLTVDGSGAAGNRSAQLTLTVSSTAVSDYSLALTSSNVTIAQGASAPIGVTLTRTNFTGPVTLSLGNAPAGVSGSFNPPAPTGDTATLTVSVDSAVAPGTYNLTVDGAGTAGNRSASLTLTVGTAGARMYTTTFPLNENPLSEGGNWITGGTTGVNWTDIQTTSGLAFGTQNGSINFNDSLAVLTGPWGPDQTATATVHTVNQQGGTVFEEVELLLRFTITANSANGYEINFKVAHDGTQYCQIVRWNGPFGDFTYIGGCGPNAPGIFDGDVIKATMIGDTISVYQNNVLLCTATDSTYTTGSPGMGFYLVNAIGINSDYGFTSYTASDGP